MTDAEYTAWLDSTNRMPCVLIDVTARTTAGAAVVRKLSNRAFEDYEPRITGSVGFSERLPLGGSPSFSMGSLEIANDDAELDAWLSDVWDTAPVEIRYGDLRWPSADFRVVVRGVVESLETASANRSLVVTVADMQKRIDTPFTVDKLPGNGIADDDVMPYIFGEVHNVQPRLIDEVAGKYQYSGRACERVIEARDDGVPITVDVQLSAGTLTLRNRLSQQLTLSVQGDAVGGYVFTVPDVILRIVTQFGDVKTRLATSDIDTANFAAVKAAAPAAVGIALYERENVWSICQYLAESIGYTLTCTRLGKLRLVRVGDTAGQTPFAIDDNDIFLDGKLTRGVGPKFPAGVKLGYAKNYTVQDTLYSGILDAHKELFAKEWLTVTRTNTAFADTYKRYVDPEQEDTALQATADAETEAARRLAFRTTNPTPYTFEGTPRLFALSLGQLVRITTHRHGFQAGKLAQVIGLDTNYASGRVSVQVIA